MPRLHALQFDFVTTPPRSTSIIVWPESPTGLSRPVDRQQSWLDVRQRDLVYVAGKRQMVATVRVYRGDGAGNETPVVECGRVWLG